LVSLPEAGNVHQASEEDRAGSIGSGGFVPRAPPKHQNEEGAAMDELWEEKDRQFAVAQESFGVSLLRQARQRVSGLPPAAKGEHPDTPLAVAASEALDHLIEHMVPVPEDKQTQASLMIAHGMIMEHLRLATTTPRAPQRT
jgi:hypothetical protein